MNHPATEHCYHCGLAINGEATWTSVIDNVTRPMCCPACKTVAETILAGGFGDYYKYRTEPASQATDGNITDADYSLYDDEQFQQQWVTFNRDDSAECRLVIGDIHCAACVWLLEQHLQRIAGIKQVSVSLSDHTAVIQWLPEQIKLSEIFHAIDHIGYSAHPFSANQQQQLDEQENRRSLRRLGIAGIGMMQTGMFSIALYAGDFQGIALEHQQLLRWVSLLIVSVVMLYCAQPFFSGASRALRMKSLNMDVPISLALIAAYSASAYATITTSGEVYFDSVTMFTFFLLVARYLEFRARQSQRTLSHQALLPTTCTRLATDNSLEQVAITQLNTGDKILVRPGETLCSDGIVVDGQAAVDESSFTGEFMPVSRTIGDEVMAGTLNTEGSLTIEVTATGQQTSLSTVEKLLSKAQLDKPETALLSDLVSRYFTAIVLLATCIAGIYWAYTDPSQAFEICLAMLVVSCPCALSLATPSALTISTLNLRQAGLIITKSHVLEQAEFIDTVCFDKTGTLTKGQLTLAETETFSDLSQAECLTIAVTLETHSEHPIAKAFTQINNSTAANNAQVITGKGVEADIRGQRYRIGSMDFCSEWQPELPTQHANDSQQSVYLIDNKQCLARFTLADELRADAAQTISALSDMGLNTMMLTGDSSRQAIALSEHLGIDSCHTHCSPADKLAHINELRAQRRNVLMIGDGINDIPVLAAADISIAMNGASDMAKVEADAALLSDRLFVIELLIRQAKKTRRIIKQNIGWALCYNFGALPLAAIGLIPPWLAALGMSLSSLLVILNARRLRRPVQQLVSQQQ